MTSKWTQTLLTLTALLILTSCRTVPDFIPNADGVLTIAYSHKVWFPPKSVTYVDSKGEKVLNERGFWADRDWRYAPPRNQ